MMPLTEDERMYFDEKFNNINEKLRVIADNTIRLNRLEIDMSKRPTTTQVIMACGFFLCLGVTLGAAIF